MRNARYSVLREIMNTNEKVGHKSKQYSYILILFAQEIFCRNSRLEIVSQLLKFFSRVYHTHLYYTSSSISYRKLLHTATKRCLQSLIYLETIQRFVEVSKSLIKISMLLLNHAPQPCSITMLLNHAPQPCSITMLLSHALTAP